MAVAGSPAGSTAASAGATLIEIANLSLFYGQSKALKSINLTD